MSWAIKISGDQFQPPAPVEGSGLHIYVIFRNGETRKSGKIRQCSGIHIGPEKDHDDDIDAQIASAISWCTRHAEAIRALVRSPGVESAYIDFMHNFSAKLYSDVIFPVELLSLLSALELRLNVTIYNQL